MITVKSLRGIEACKEGIEVFAAVYPDGLDPAAWTLEEQLRVLKHTELRKYLGWAWKNKVVPQWSMSKVDLNGTNLTGASLPWTDLCRANLTEADLCWAILTGASLSGVSLTEANLTRADLYQANLNGANLYRADLREADLTGAILYRADLREADLTGAILYRADLTGANLSEADLAGVIWDEREPPAGWRKNEEGKLER